MNRSPGYGYPRALTAAEKAELKGTAGRDGTNGKDGVNGTAGKDGLNGTNGTNGAAGKDGANGAPGKDGLNGTNGTNGAPGKDGTNGKDGLNGTNGSPANTLMGTVVIGQTATIAIALGNREVTAALAGTVVGGRYQAFCDSYKLNGGASVGGRPAGYAILDTVCNIAGQITVTVTAPLLAIGASYALTCSIVRVNV